MKLKKLLSTVLCFAMLFGFSTNAYAAEDAYTVLEAASAKNALLQSSDMSIKMSGTMQSGKITETVSTIMNAQYVKKGETDFDMKATVNTKVDEESISMGIYYSNGNYYMNYGEIKVKMPMDISNTIQQVQSSTSTAKSKNIYQNMQMVKGSTGEAVITYQIKPDEINKVMDPQIKSMLSAEVINSKDVKIQYKQLQGTAIVNDTGYLTAQNMKGNCVITIGSESATFTFDMDIVFNNPGQAVNIQPPTDLSEYFDFATALDQAA